MQSPAPAATSPASSPPTSPAALRVPRIDFIADTEEVAASQGEALARRWAPRVRLHPRTQFSPIAAGDYVAHCEAPFNTWDALLSAPGLGLDVRLRPDVAAIREAHAEGSLAPTVHAIVRRFRSSAGAAGAASSGAKEFPLRGFWLIYYVFLYADQPDARLFGCCMPFSGTGHVADLEWVAVLLEPSGLRSAWTFYSAHGNTESSWVPSTPATAYSPPPVFVALDVQANYPTGGRKNRIWFATADLCASDDDPELSYALEYLYAAHPFRHFAGLLGPDGIAAPGRGGGNRFDLPGSDTNHIDTAFARRMFRTS